MLKINFIELFQNEVQKEHFLRNFKTNEFLLGSALFFLPISIKLNSLCLILFFVSNLYNRIVKRSVFGLSVFLFAFIFFLIQLIGFSNSLNGAEASKKLILFLVFPLLAILLPRKEIKIDNVFRYLLFGVIVILIYAFLNSIYDVFFLNERFDYGRGPDILLKYTPHHAYMSLFIIISILVIIYQIGKKKISFYNLFFIPFLFITLFILPSRTALLIAIIILPICTISFLKQIYTFKQIALILLVLLIIGALGLSIDFTRDKLIYAYYEFLNIPTPEKPFNGISTRQKIWKTCLDLIARTPFFGFGIGDVQDVLNEQYLKQGYDGLLNLNAHNQYLQNILQYGVFLSSIIVCLFLQIIRKLIYNKLWLLFWIWIITLLFLGTESMLNRQWGVGYFAILLILSCYSINLKYFNEKLM